MFYSACRFLLTDKLFTQRTLPLPALHWLVGFLGHTRTGMQDGTAVGEVSPLVCFQDDDLELYPRI